MEQYKAKGGRGGRPSLQDELRRMHTVGVRLNSSELDALKRKADSLGLPLGQWLRKIALNRFVPRPLVPEINQEAYAELAHLDSNLNHLAKASHTGKTIVSLSLLHQANNKLHSLRLELLGVKNDSQND